MDKEIVENEGQELMKNLNGNRMDNISDYQIDLITKGVIRGVKLGVKKALAGFKLSIPDTQKIEGEVTIKDEIIANIKKWPVVQKISGTVNAIVQFPQLQKVFIKNKSLKVEVINTYPQKTEVTNFPEYPSFPDFPEFPKEIGIKGKVATDIPQIEAGNRNVVPVVFWDGQKAFSFSQLSTSNGRIIKAVQDLQSAVQTQSLFYTGQRRVTVSGNAVTLPSADIKTVVVQALKDNRDAVYIGAGANGDFELQPGQPLTIVIDNLSKIKLYGSYINDGICYSAS